LQKLLLAKISKYLDVDLGSKHRSQEFETYNQLKVFIDA